MFINKKLQPFQENMLNKEVNHSKRKLEFMVRAQPKERLPWVNVRGNRLVFTCKL